MRIFVFGIGGLPSGILKYKTYIFAYNLQNTDYQSTAGMLFKNNLQKSTFLVHLSLKETLLDGKRAFGH